MGATANELYRKLSEITRLCTEIRTDIATLEIADSTLAGQEDRPRTGWRWIRGEQSGTYVRDPNGTDRLPPNYDLRTHAHPGDEKGEYAALERIKRGEHPLDDLPQPAKEPA